ncbi:MAG: right-handed parallel beta-helix repeat-containing protein [Candidatus Bipolaricaulaceae bacterium]
MRRLLALFLLILSGLFLGCSPQPPMGEHALLLQPGQSIQAVIDSAPPGSTLILSRGTWTENLRIEKSIAIRGQGPEATVIQAERAGPPVLWVGKEAWVSLEGLTIRGGRGGYAGPKMSSAGVFLAENAILTLRHVKISQNAASGVFASDKAVLNCEGAEISENTRYGLELVGEARAHLKGAKIAQNGMGGLWVSSAGDLELEDSLVAQNAGVGLWVRDKSKVKLWATEVRENGGPGLRGEDASEVRLLASRVLNHLDVGVEVSGDVVFEAYGTIFQENWHGLVVKGGTAFLQRCSVLGNRWDGLDARGRAFVRLEGSEFSGGRGSGVASAEKASVVLIRCLIHGFLASGASGFSAIPMSGEENKFEGNGVALLGNVEPSLRGKISPTLQFLPFPHPDFPDLQSAVDALLPGGVLEIQSGTYSAGVTVDKAVEIRAKGEVTLRGLNPSAPVLSCVAGADLRLLGVEVTGGSEGLALGANATATLVNCTISENAAGIKLWQNARLFAEGVSVFNHAQGGIWLWDESQAELRRVTVRRNDMCGIGAGGRSSLGLYQSLVEENGWFGGLLLREGARVELRDNRFVRNKGYGLAVESSACVGSGPGFWGEVLGSGNEFLENYKGPLCPAELSFLGR